MTTKIKPIAHWVNLLVFVSACLGIGWLGLTGLIYSSWFGIALLGALASLVLLSDLARSDSNKTITIENAESSMKKNSQREAYEAFVRSGESPVSPSEVDNPCSDGTYRTSAANAGWVFWQAAQASKIAN